MSSTAASRVETRVRCYHGLILAGGILVALNALMGTLGGDGLDWRDGVTVLLGVPLIVLIARFPMVLDSGSGGIEVGFDSSILMFLLCDVDTPCALVVWSGGVLVTQLISGKRTAAKVFNIGVGILAAGLAAVVYDAVNAGGPVDTARSLVAVALAAGAYFVTDYVLSGVSVAISTGSPLAGHLRQPGVLTAIACFIPLDSLGYLGAVVVKTTPVWTLSLLAVPLVTLLIATRAVTRGRENARRLTVLFDAAVKAQALSDRDAVVRALCADAASLLRLSDVTMREEPPGADEIGTVVWLGEQRCWLVARAMNRARSTVAADGQALRALAAVASDAIARLELTAEMVHVARHDPLTDLPNRGILLDRVTVALHRAVDRGSDVALLFIDLDGFKPVNDRFGHAVGDTVLIEVAGRLRSAVRPADTVARLGGDEFAILLEDVDPAQPAQVCARLLAAIQCGVRIAGQDVPLGASVGIAMARGGSSSAVELLRNADLAMYEAKAAGKGRYVVYEPAMGSTRVERLEMIDDLRRAVECGDIDVVYQPVVQVDTQRIVGLEALARWQRHGVPVSPDVFIRIAEESGLILALGEAVLERVAADTAALVEAAETRLAISVNVSAAQLRDPTFPATVARSVETMRDAQLILELTERQDVDSDAKVIAAMHDIRSRGALFAIDDFGVGFSSISYLHSLPARILKADASLSALVDRDERARDLLRSVFLMGHTLGLDVVIEGIERESQLAIVREDAPQAFAQGYLLHRPMALGALLEVLAAERVA